MTRPGVRLKFWFFASYWWILGVILLGTLTLLVCRGEPMATVATVAGAQLSLIYFVQKQKLEELRLFREIFKEFNNRYDHLNEQLDEIAKVGERELSSAQRSVLVDYFNLCGEEYLYFERGYIDPVVWRAWHNGMKERLSHQRVREVWDAEKQADSYYGLPL